MRRTTMFAIGLAVAVATTTGVVQAQATPNFAGSWTKIVDPNVPAAAFGMGPSFTIVQDARTLTVTMLLNGNSMKDVYNLDGTDSKNTNTYAGTTFDQHSVAKWDAGAFKVTTNTDFNGTPLTTTMTLSMDASGNLVAVTTFPDVGDGNGPTTATEKYKKGG